MLGALTGGQIQGGYDQLCNCIIRPGRCEYTLKDLGPNRFRAGGIEYTRTDFDLRNPRGLKIQASHYEPAPGYRPKPKLPCVIYLHGNCGSRLDGLDALELLLPYNITVVTLDFTGSGISEGDYVSLGYYEKDDLKTVVEYLRASDTVTRIGLWGRSMGAATAILYAHMDPCIAGMVLDSGFASLSMLAKELAEQAEFKIPKMVVSIALKMIRKSIKSRAGFDINKLEPIQYVDSCFVPALFAHGNQDAFILPHHSKELHDKYAGDKNIVFFDGDHNTRRPEFFFDSVSIFFHNVLLVDEDKDLVNHIVRQTTTAPPPTKPAVPTGPSIEDLENDLLQQALLLSMQEIQAPPEALAAVKADTKPEGPPSKDAKQDKDEKDKDRRSGDGSAAAVSRTGSKPSIERGGERNSVAFLSPARDGEKSSSGLSGAGASPTRRASWGGFLRTVSPGRRDSERRDQSPAAAAAVNSADATREEKKKSDKV